MKEKNFLLSQGLKRTNPESEIYLSKKGGDKSGMFLTPQTQGDVSPQRALRSWHRVLKNNKVRLKNYLFFLIYKSLNKQSWTILEWKLAEEGAILIRNQLPDLYSVITFLLLEIKDRRENWNGENYYFNEVPHWIPRSLVRGAYGIGRGITLDVLLIVQEKLRADTQALLGNNVLLELGVTENPRSVTFPQRKRGYHDHGTYLPAHKRGRNSRLPSEPDSEFYLIGDDPERDLELLSIIGTSEFFFFLQRQEE